MEANAKAANTPNLPGGSGGSTILDLRKPSDAALVHRAVLNGWDVPEHIRAQLAAQLSEAITQTRGNPTRRDSRAIKLARLALVMDAQNVIAEGHPKSAFPYVRKRHPEHRRPRRTSK